MCQLMPPCLGPWTLSAIAAQCSKRISGFSLEGGADSSDPPSSIQLLLFDLNDPEPGLLGQGFRVRLRIIDCMACTEGSLHGTRLLQQLARAVTEGDRCSWLHSQLQAGSHLQDAGNVRDGLIRKRAQPSEEDLFEGSNASTARNVRNSATAKVPKDSC